MTQIMDRDPRTPSEPEGVSSGATESVPPALSAKFSPLPKRAAIALGLGVLAWYLFLADYVAANPDAIVCMETEFPHRPDGLVLFETATNFQIPDAQIEILEIGVIYQETANGNCTFGEIFTTDGRIAALGLDVVDDPGINILYNVSLTMPDQVYQQAPGAHPFVRC